MYRTECLKDDCDYSYQDPTESSAVNRMQSHIEDTGHEVLLQGVYDSPTNGGVHGPDGQRSLTKQERMERL